MKKDPVVRHTGDYRWEGVEILNYKNEGAHFQAITRQVLFDGVPELPCQLRYFEIAPGGYSTLERHQHVHRVFVLRGRGQALLGQEIVDLKEFDLVTIGPCQWHQFRGTGNEPFGFLCLVNAERDQPQLPGREELKKLRSNPAVDDFIRV
ncbi:MAG: cupin domain-containing protein [Syntrophomonadaceae bacterium]|nr:cupin domain-containing protein [Syntrophomonadaceae bacterium]